MPVGTGNGYLAPANMPTRRCKYIKVMSDAVWHNVDLYTRADRLQADSKRGIKEYAIVPHPLPLRPYLGLRSGRPGPLLAHGRRQAYHRCYRFRTWNIDTVRRLRKSNKPHPSQFTILCRHGRLLYYWLQSTKHQESREYSSVKSLLYWNQE
jgi:hypothetical protein